MWQTVQFVTSGLALVAFVWAGAVTLIRIRLKERERLILSASEKDRAGLVQEALETFHVDAKRLPLKDQTQLVLERMRGDLQRFRIKAIVVSFLAVLFAGITLFAISKATEHAEPGSSIPPASTQAPQSDENSSSSAASSAQTDSNSAVPVNLNQEDRCNVPLEELPLDCPLR